MKNWIASCAIVASAALLAPAFAGDDGGASVPDAMALLDEHASAGSAAADQQFAVVGEPSDTVFVEGTSHLSDSWPAFGRRLTDAATPSCLDSSAAQHALFVPEGLLRMPFLVSAAADGTCR
jgi:hypothetical protein